MDSLRELAIGFSVALTTANLLASFTGVLLGTIVGILPGVGPVARSRCYYRRHSGYRPRRHSSCSPGLLRCSVWRLDISHPSQPAWGGFVGRDLHRWLCDGTTGPRRRGVDDSCDRFVRRRLRRYGGDRRLCTGAHKDRAVIRSGRIRRAVGMGPGRGRGVEWRAVARRRSDGRARDSRRPCRRRPDAGRRAVYVRHFANK